MGVKQSDTQKGCRAQEHFRTSPCRGEKKRSQKKKCCNLELTSQRTRYQGGKRGTEFGVGGIVGKNAERPVRSTSLRGERNNSKKIIKANNPRATGKT